MADSHLKVVDRPVTTGSVKPSVNVRLEINDFIKNDYYFTLFVMALRKTVRLLVPKVQLD